MLEFEGSDNQGYVAGHEAYDAGGPDPELYDVGGPNYEASHTYAMDKFGAEDV